MQEQKRLLFSWPALEMSEPLPQQLNYERAIWGKVHGAPSDFRWIAVSSGFRGSEQKVEQHLQLGSEDAVASMSLWKAVGNFYYAVYCYPSRAADASGRRGFLEKQIIEWRQPEGVPAVLAALLLLPGVAQFTGFTDEIWWNFFDDPRWLEVDFFLEIAKENYLPVQVSTAECEQVIAAGCKMLAESMPEEKLQELYALILAGQHPVVLNAIEQSLKPEAIAALMLPLPRQTADTISVAGWLPSRRFNIDHLSQRWGVIGNGLNQSLTTPVSVVPTKEQWQQAQRMTQAILANDPSVLNAAAPQPDDAQKSAPQTSKFRLVLWGPSSSGKTVFMAQLYTAGLKKDEDWKLYPQETAHMFVQQMRKTVEHSNTFPPATSYGQVDQLVYEFSNEKNGLEAALEVEDRAGKQFEEFNEEAQERIRNADGLILLFDPERFPYQLKEEVMSTLEKVYLARGTSEKKDYRPVAICITKADILIETIEDYRSAKNYPDTFVRRFIEERINPDLIQVVEQYCAWFRFFPVSAAGLRIAHGAIEPTVFYDEKFTSRICFGGKPFNLLAPFSWVIESLANQS